MKQLVITLAEVPDDPPPCPCGKCFNCDVHIQSNIEPKSCTHSERSFLYALLQAAYIYNKSFTSDPLSNDGLMNFMIFAVEEFENVD